MNTVGYYKCTGVMFNATSSYVNFLVTDVLLTQVLSYSGAKGVKA